MAEIRVNILPCDTADLDLTLDRLTQAGLTNSKIMRFIRIIHGTVDDSKVEDLKAVPGIESVEIDGPMYAVKCENK